MINTERTKKRLKIPAYRAYQNKYSKKWKKEQRRLNTPYAERQKKLKREYCRSESGKKQTREWRRKNIKRVLEYNRKRILAKKGIVGFHTNKEWEDIKQKYDYKCYKCGITEEELKNIWKGTKFNKLTKDHIIPLSKKGPDFIENIQPMCITCNTKKWKHGEVY
jgi:5-methylcytosine-specific restriction endonuclease McrA